MNPLLVLLIAVVLGTLAGTAAGYLIYCLFGGGM